MFDHIYLVLLKNLKNVESYENIRTLLKMSFWVSKFVNGLYSCLDSWMMMNEWEFGVYYDGCHVVVVVRFFVDSWVYSC